MIEYKTNIPKISLTKKATEIPKVKIKCSSDINEYVRNFYHEDLTLYESFFIVLLNQSHNTIGYVKISQGGIVGTVVDIRLICKYAIEALAVSIVFVHNHPSGNLTPSEADKRLTTKAIKALDVFDIKVLDHIIIVEEPDKYYSFADEGILY